MKLEEINKLMMTFKGHIRETLKQIAAMKICIVHLMEIPSYVRYKKWELLNINMMQ